MEINELFRMYIVGPCLSAFMGIRLYHKWSDDGDADRVLVFITDLRLVNSNTFDFDLKMAYERVFVGIHLCTSGMEGNGSTLAFAVSWDLVKFFPPLLQIR
jgi:hypothetical protein